MDVFYKLAKQVAIIMTLFTIFLVVFLPYISTQLIWLPIVGGILLGIVFYLLHIKQGTIAKFILCLYPISITSITYCLLSTREGDSLTGIYATIIALHFGPLLLFSENERKTMFITYILGVSWILLIPFIDNYLNISDHEFSNIALVDDLFLFGATCLLVGIFIAWNNKEKLSTQRIKLLEIELSDKRVEYALAEEDRNNVVELLKKSKAEDERHNWVTEGVNNMNQSLRDHFNDLEFYPIILNVIVKYLNANQGFIYIVEESNQESVLELKSSFAYDRKKFLQKTIRKGDGLTGQVWIDEEILVLTDVPNNFTFINSGLGEATPSTILIAPLIGNGEVVGIIELASFSTFDIYQLEYIREVTKVIGAGIVNKVVTIKTKHLLDIASVQSEQLQSQEEELRQNMEEMVAVQEHLEQQVEINKRNVESLEFREKVIGETTILSESDQYGNIVFINDKFCEISQYSSNELVGRSHNIVRHPDMPSALFRILWETIKAGKVFNGIIKNQARDGSHYWVDATIVPIIDSNGKFIKYIGARYHIKDDECAEKLFIKQMKKFNIE